MTATQGSARILRTNETTGRQVRQITKGDAATIVTIDRDGTILRQVTVTDATDLAAALRSAYHVANQTVGGWFA